MLNLLFVLAGIYIKYINIFIDGSFFVPYLFFICTVLLKRTARCTACLYGMLSRIIVLRRKLNYLPKASTKVRQISFTANYFKLFFHKKSNYFQVALIFNDLQKL